MNEPVRAHVIISGRVQGVFFRAETQRSASGLNLSGWVKNNHDGTVEAVFEGEESNVNQMLIWCRKGPPRSRVDHVAVEWERFSGEFSGFNVRF
ncbi:MAG: acylphosphatase [Thermodesulfobacteriota bacterium]